MSDGLSINSTKFCTKGFIRLRAAVHEGNVRLFVEDSGPGLPKEKRESLFQAFQVSLDELQQGTGIGLSICRTLSNLMGANIWLDETYTSGIEGCPGACFIIDLQKPPMGDFDSLIEQECKQGNHLFSMAESEQTDTTSNIDCSCNSHPPKGSEKSSNDPSNNQASSQVGGVDNAAQNMDVELPEGLKVLFVDDEAILRKLFVRSVLRVCPTWTIEEASDGDTALNICASESFDIVFMDQYMPNIGRPLLGTEVVRQLRSRMGLHDCAICGLSANDMREDFIQAGADGFLMKPFPCEKSRLQRELLRLLAPAAERLASLSSSPPPPPTTTKDRPCCSSSPPDAGLVTITNCGKKISPDPPNGESELETTEVGLQLVREEALFSV